MAAEGSPETTVPCIEARGIVIRNSSAVWRFFLKYLYVSNRYEPTVGSVPNNGASLRLQCMELQSFEQMTRFGKYSHRISRRLFWHNSKPCYVTVLHLPVCVMFLYLLWQLWLWMLPPAGKIHQENECNKCCYKYFIIIAGPGRYNEFGVEDQAGTVHRLQWTNLRWVHRMLSSINGCR